MTHTALITTGGPVCLPHEVVIRVDAWWQTSLPSAAQNQTEKIAGLSFIPERLRSISSNLSKG